MSCSAGDADIEIIRAVPLWANKANTVAGDPITVGIFIIILIRGVIICGIYPERISNNGKILVIGLCVIVWCNADRRICRVI